MRSIKELAPKPSDAISAMVRGIRRGIKTEHFIVDMGVYLGAGKEKCVGCAATCTITEIADMEFPRAEELNIDKDEELLSDDNLRYTGSLSDRYRKFKSPDRYPRLNSEEVERFEMAIDNLRQGNIRELAEFYDIPPSVIRLAMWQQFGERGFFAARGRQDTPWMTHRTKIGSCIESNKEDSWETWLKNWEKAAESLKQEGF